MGVREGNHKERGESNKRARLHRGEPLECKRKLTSGSGEEGIWMKRRETSCTCMFGAEIFLLEPERG